MAGATVAAIPMLLIFILFQQYFTRGISIGAVKE
jgi:multiple sugar transport system permease protein